MSRPPYPPGESIFARGLGRDVIWVGLFMGILTLALGYAYWDADQVEYWRTIIFTTLTFAQMTLALAVRSSRDSLFDIGLTSNKPLLGAILMTILLQLLVIYLPLFQGLFETRPLAAIDLGICVLVSTLVFWAVEIEKWWQRRKG